MSGTGGDELFGGYPWRYYRAYNSCNFEDYIDRYYLYWQRLVNNKLLKRFFEPINHEVKDIWTKDIFKNVFPNNNYDFKSPKDYINHSLYLEYKTFLPGLFHVEDKLSMAHSLETRVPFMDNDLVDFALKCPVSKKLDQFNENERIINENDIGNKKESYFIKTNDGKKILREMMSKYIPEEITQGIKKGFSPPDQSWFKGESIEFVRRRLIRKKSPIYEFLDRETIVSTIEEHFSGKQNRRLYLVNA